MNKFFKRSAALLATALVFLSGGICLQNGGFAGTITASAVHSEPQKSETASQTEKKQQTEEDIKRLFSSVVSDGLVANRTVENITVRTGYDTAELSWEKVSGAESYNIYAGTDPKRLGFAASSETNSVVISGLEPESEYTFAIEGKVGEEYTQAGTTSAKTLGFETLKVGNVKADAGLESVTLSWDAVKDSEKYAVIVKDKNGRTCFDKTTEQTTLKVTDLISGNEYTCTIQGISGEKTSQSSTVNVTAADVRSLKAGNIKAEASFDTTSLSWDSIESIEKYIVSVKDENGTVTQKKETKENSVELKGLVPGTRYTVTVQGQYKGKLTLGSSAVFETKDLGTLKVGSLKSGGITPDSITLSWDKLKEADTYNVYLKDKNGKYTLVSSVSTNSITLSKLTAGTGYTYAVRGQKSGKLTAVSEITASTLRKDVEIKFEALNQLGGKGNSGKVKATYGCGGTSTTMLLNAKGLDLNKDTVLKKQYTNGWNACFCKLPFPYAAASCGSVLSNLVNLAKSYGFTPKVNTAPKAIDIMRVLNNDDLVLVGLRTARGAHHFQIIYGYYIKDGETYFRVQDPYGNTCSDWTQTYLMQRIYAVNMKDPLCAQVRGIMWL